MIRFVFGRRQNSWDLVCSMGCGEPERTLRSTKKLRCSLVRRWYRLDPDHTTGDGEKW